MEQQRLAPEGTDAASPSAENSGKPYSLGFEPVHFIIPSTDLLAYWALKGKSRGWAIDIGCGAGEVAVELARQAPELRVVCLDLSYQMLIESCSLAVEAGLKDRMAFCEGAAEHMPFADGTFDLVVSTCCLHHWAEPLEALNEIARVLKPDGTFLIFDIERGFKLRSAASDDPYNLMSSALTSEEAERLVSRSQLRNWRVRSGEGWFIIESADLAS